MRRRLSSLIAAFNLVIACSVQSPGVAWSQTVTGTAANRANLPDSFKYYGPQGLWQLWNRDDWQTHRIGRDTWIFWTWGNQKFLRFGMKGLGNQALPISLDLFRLLDSRNRDRRFAQLGLINEPNCRKADKPDQFGLWLDVWDQDPEHYYPGDPVYDQKQHYPGTQEAVDTRNYGRPSGILGLRLLDNPKFDRAKWNVNRYFESPGSIEPPFLVGFSCALCHIGFDPTNPPSDPNRPRWENLAANIGNQYLREGDLIFTSGRVLFGDRNPGPARTNDPYDTAGIGPDDFLYHYAATQQPGTSETSRISYDFINNPNTINAIFNLKHRRTFPEINPNGKPIETMHVLKDGADSVGVEWALMRVPINIGCEGVYWSGSLFNPFTGSKQHPFRIAEALCRLPAAEKQKLTQAYGLDFSSVTDDRIAAIERQYADDFGADFGKDWAEAWKRNGSLATYLMSYGPYPLKSAPGGEKHLTQDQAQLRRGKLVFADHCARCHSNKQPPVSTDAVARRQFYRDSVLEDDFLKDNTLTDDVRYSVVELGTNMARALATNAVEDDVWAHFSSRDYKALPSITVNRNLELQIPVFPGQSPIPVTFNAPGGGRGYYRTPSLVSMWATAPYFHNNSLGKFTGKVSVEARLEEFNDAVTKLLWPEKRDMGIKRTSRPSSLLPGISAALPRLLAQRLAAVFADSLRSKLPPNLADAAVRDIQPALEQAIGELIPKIKTVEAPDLEAQFAELIDRRLSAVAGRLEFPGDVLEPLRRALHQRSQRDMDMMRSLNRLDITRIPAGTPVNLLANLNISKVPYAALENLLHKPGSREWAEALLNLSDCPDLVEDKGHLYGAAELTDAEKRDLIEFLKTL